MKLYSRQQIAQKLGLSLSTLRRYLNKVGIQPSRVDKNKTQLPVYLYSQQSLDQLTQLTAEYRSRSRTGQHKCCICKQPVAIDELYGTRCQKCYIQRYSLPLVFGDKPWKKVLNKHLLQQAIDYLQSIIHPAKSDSAEPS